MQCSDQGCKLILRDILKLVNEQHDGRSCGARSFACGADKVRKIGFEVSAISKADLRLKIDRHLDVGVAEPQLHKAGQRPQRAPRAVARSGQSIHFEQGRTQ